MEGRPTLRAETRSLEDFTMTEQASFYTKRPFDWFGLRPWTRHSLVLLVAGLCYFGVGFSYMFAEPGGGSYKNLAVARMWMPLHHWGLVFMFVAVLTMISSRWPPTADKWGYMVMTGLSAGWGAFYVMGVIFANVPTAAVSGAFVWWLLAFMWWAISGLVNPVRVVIVSGPRSDS
jgi:hypothetical protein